MFLHGGWLHFLGNMLYLWIFGDNVEDRLGHVPLPALLSVLRRRRRARRRSRSTRRRRVPMIGASGAIAGVMGAYFVLYPHSRVLTAVFIVFFIDIDRDSGDLLPRDLVPDAALQRRGLARRTTPPSGGVAFWAHIGGFAAGALLAPSGGPRRRNGAKAGSIERTTSLVTPN